jgi:hypothetical protein
MSISTIISKLVRNLIDIFNLSSHLCHLLGIEASLHYESRWPLCDCTLGMYMKHVFAPCSQVPPSTERNDLFLLNNLLPSVKNEIDYEKIILCYATKNLGRNLVVLVAGDNKTIPEVQAA